MNSTKSAGIEMADFFSNMSQRKVARNAGLLYLIYIVILVFTTIVQLPRIGFMSEVLSTVFFLLAAWALYVLLKPVNKNLALLFVLLNLGGVAVQCTGALSEFASLILLSGADYLKVFQVAQLQALAMFFRNFGTSGFMIANVFYGVWLFPLGYLVLKSGFLPRILGILLIIDGFAVLMWVFQFFLFPAYGVITYLLYPVMFIAEFSFSLWLLVKGVKVQQMISSSDNNQIKLT